MDAIRRQEITAVDLTETFIDRITRVNPKINAYCTPTFDLAREQAKQADQRVKRREKLPPLNGVPTSVKDLMETKGIRTTYGSKIYEHNVPDVTDAAVQRLLDAGIVLLGKTNTPEFGYAGVTENKVFGTTRNPWKLDRTSGGSSGGAAAACAAGLSPLAIGSDGGGSIRHPACFCGVFGIKPQFGRVPSWPRLGIMGETISHHGPITRYVEDAALMLDVIKGPHPLDTVTLPADGISYRDGLKNRYPSLKIGFSLTLGYAKQVDPEVERVTRAAVAKFERVGWTVEEAAIKLKNPEPGFYVWYTSTYAYDLRLKLAQWRDQMMPDLVKLVEAGSASTGFDIFKALIDRRALTAGIASVLDKYDLLVTPTTAIPAFELGRMFPAQINGKNVSPTGWQPFTFPFNVTGHPAATVPSGFSSSGLPIGLQIVGRRFAELTVLQAAKAFEEVAPWQATHPPIA